MLKVMVNGKVVQGTKVVVQNGDKIVLTDTRTGQSPIKMVTKKVGKSLHIFEEGAQEPSLVLEDYYAQGIPAQVSGIDASGGYVNYAVADSGSMELMSGPLEDTAAGEAVAAAGTTAAGTGLSTAAMVGLGALGVGAVALAAGGGGGSSTAPAAPADTTAPTAPTIALASDTGASASDGITNASTINVAGLESGATWQYQIDGGTWTTGSGTSFTASAGVHTYAVRQTDAASNISSASIPLSITLDTTTPTPVSMSALGTTVAVTFSEAMDTAHFPTNAFSVLVNNVATTVSSVSVSGAVVTLTIGTTLTTGTSVQVGYADPTANTDDANAIQDTAGNDAASFLSGVVADGYVRGAEVWIDVDGSGTVDPGVDYFVGMTDSVGNFFIPDSAPSGSIIATGGVNIDTGVPNTMPLRAPEGSTVINPLTTLVQAVIESDTTGGTTVAEASASVVAALGLTSGTDLTTYDPISEGDVAAQQAAATVATIISLATAGTTDTVATITTNTIISNLVTEIQTSTTTTTVMDLADSTTLSNLITGVVLTDTVQSSIADASAAIQTAATLSDITTAQSVALDTVGVGASTLTVAATTNDTTPTVHVNLSTTATDGTAAIEGDTVILKADGIQVGTATLSAANILAGYVNITTADLSEGAHSLSAVVIDQAGNMGVSYPVKTVTVDTIPPAPSAINVVAADDIINALEAASGVTITGVISAGSTVTVNGNPAVVSGTTWSYVLDAAAITAMGEGSETITVIATDLANNSVTTTKTISIDTLAPTGQTIGMIAGDNAINAAEKAAGVAITGTAEAGAIVTLSIGGNLYKITADTTSGTWSHTLAAVDYTAMGAGSETITATATDAAGNTSSLTHTITIDTTAPLLASFVLETASDSGIKLDGKSNITAPQFKLTAELGSTLEMKIGTGSFANVGTGTGSTQTITAPAMVEGSNVVVLRATDAAGNVTERTLNYTLDTTAPAAPIMLNISPDSGAADGITNVKDGVATGTAEANSTVNITINGTPMAAVTTDALGNWSMPYTNLPDGTYTAIATVTDAAGNISGLSVPVTMIVDTTIATPIVSLANDTAGTTDHITSDASLTLSTAAIDVTRTFTVDGATAVSTYTAPTADGSHTVLVTDTDTAGNVATASLAFTLDTVLPTATISLSDLTITKGETANVTITFSEVPSGFDPAVDLAVYGGSLSAGSFDLSGKVWTAIFTPTDDLQVSGSPIGLAGSAWTDTAGNASVSNAWSQDASIDTHTPTATITMADGALKIGETSLVTITFNEPITNFANDDVTVANGTLSTLISSNAGMTWTAMFTPTAEVTNTSNVITLANTYTDIAGNTGTAATSANYTIDTAIATPAVALATNSGSTADTITNDASLTLSPLAIDVTRTFTVDGGTASGSYVAPTTDGSHTVLVTDTDTAGNIATASLTFTLDKTAPTATITMADLALKIGETSPVMIVFSEAVTGFTNADLTIANGTLTDVASTDGGITWIAAFTPTADISSVSNVVTLATSYSDVAGNTGTSATSANYLIDTSAPTITISAISSGYVNNTEDESAVTVSGTTTGVENNQTLTVTINSVDYTATVTSNAWTLDIPSVNIKALTEGLITARANVSDAAGNPAAQATQTFVYDITTPTYTSFATAAVSENTTATIYTAAATGAASYSLGGTDAALFNVDSTSGAVAFKVAPDYENPADAGTNNIYDFTVTATDAAGNTADQVVAITVNNVDVTVNDVATDNIINAVEKVAGVTITGNNEPGITALTVNGAAATVVGTSWSYTLDTAAITAMGEDVKILTIVSGGTTITKDIMIDTVAPMLTIDDVSDGNVLNAVEISTGGPITGTTNAEEGRIVSVSVDNTVIGTAVVANGIWGINVSPTMTSMLIEGNHTVTASVSDLAGNPTTTNKTFSVDTVAPVITMYPATADNILNAVENTKTTKTITGTTTAEDGQIVTYKVDGIAKGTGVVSNGAWSVTFEATAPFLSDGTHVRSAEVSDTVGNIATVSSSFTVDTIAPAIIAASGFTYTDTGATDGITSNGTINVSLAGDTSTWQYSVDNGASWTTGTGSSFVLSSGSHDKSNILVKQFDLAGNSSISAMNSHIVQLEAIGNTTGADTFARSIAVGTAGEYMVAFQGIDSDLDSSIFLQKFNADGTVAGSMVQIEALGNTIGYDNGVRMSAVGDAGDYVVTFRGQDDNGFGDKSIFVQKFNANGTVVGSMVQLEAIGNTTGADDWSRITAIGTTGEYVVTFEGIESTGDKSIFVQKFNANGTTQGSMVQLEAIGNANGNDINPHITAIEATNAYVVVFPGIDDSGVDSSIFVQQFNADGTQASMVQLEAIGVTDGEDILPRITEVGTLGEYVVTFEGIDSSGTDKSIFVQKFNANGTTAGSMVQLEAIGNTTGADTNTQITAVGITGAYVVTFVGADSAGDNSIFVQKFNADGTQAAMVQLEAFGNTTGIDSNPRITAVGATGEYVVSFVGADSAGDNSIFVQKFNADGTLAGSMVQLEALANDTGTDAYARPISVGTAGEYIVTFEGVDSAGDNSIFVQKFNADGTLAITVDTPPLSAPQFYFNEMTNQVYVNGIEYGATWEYQINGGTWTAGEGNSFIVSEINGDYTVAVRQTDAALNVSATSTDMVTVGDNYSFSTAALIAPETAITAFPSGATFTDGYVTILFSTDGATGTITEPNGAVHALSIVNGAASATVDGTTYTYKMLASDGDMMVLGQTDTDLTVEMNGEVQGPPPVWTLINTAATADVLPTGTTTFYTTDTDNFGDHSEDNDWTKIAFDFGAKTLQGFALDGTAFTSETFTVVNNQIIIHEPSGNYDSTITQIGTANGFYAFTEDYVETWTWGMNSAYGVSDMAGHLTQNSDYLWQENGSDHNKNGTTDDYGKVIRDIDGNVIAFEERYGGMLDITSAALTTANALTVNWGGSMETYSVDDNVMPNDTSDNEIKVVEVGTNVFSLATANPFSYTYTVDGDTILPTITSASVNGSQLFLTFSEPLDYNSQPPLSMITVMVNGTTSVATTGGYPYGNNSVQIYLDPSVIIAAGDTVTISYNDPLGNNANVVQDTSGNDLATVTNMAVTNQTGFPQIYLVGMSPVSMEGTGVNSVITFEVNRSGDTTSASTVNWTVSAGTTDSSDFVGGVPIGGTVTFAAGETVQTITIPVVGDWVPEGEETFTLNLSDPVNGVLSTSTLQAWISNDDPIPNALILNATLSATESAITFPASGTVFTDGYVTMEFTDSTTGTITELKGTPYEVVHALTLSGGVATVYADATTTTAINSYKFLTSSTDALVLAQTDFDLTVEMNGYVDGPPVIWTLINTAAVVDAIPTTGILTLFDTDTDNYGDLNGSSDVKITFDFDNQTAQHYAIDGTPTFLESFSVFNNTMIFDDGAMKSYVTLMANSAGYYTFKENYVENQNWGTGSAQNSVDISAYLSATSDILWSENGMDYNGNGTMYDYGMVTRTAGVVDGFVSYTSNTMDHTDATTDYTAVATLGANALVIDEGDRISTYSVASTNLDPAVLTDNAISVVTTGTEVFTFAENNPFTITYAYEMDMGYGTVGVGLHDGMALNVANDLGYTNNTLFCINSVTDTAANTITISVADVLAQGAFADGTPFNTADNVIVNAVGINAGSNDILNATGGWIDTTQTITIKGIDYSVYADANMTAQLYVSNSITPSPQVI